VNKEEIKIITLGDIFDNLETEEQAFKFLKYIKNQQQELERYKNIIDELEKYCWELKAMGCREGALDMLDKIKELKGE
jgi:ferritin